MCLLLGSMHWFDHFVTFLHYGMWHVWWRSINHVRGVPGDRWRLFQFLRNWIKRGKTWFFKRFFKFSINFFISRAETIERALRWRSETTELRPSTISHYCSVASLKHPLSLIKLQQVNLVGFHYCRKRTMLFSSWAAHNFRLYRLFWSLIEHLVESTVSVLQTNHFSDVSRLHRDYIVREARLFFFYFNFQNFYFHPSVIARHTTIFPRWYQEIDFQKIVFFKIIFSLSLYSIYFLQIWFFVESNVSSIIFPFLH